ncbi:hypothetical protein GCM10011391_32020 [Pullulanibacillus camelliae]|uniref:DUF2269 family protein n=1 Tax=Pullulanibacillus camelliae TaxID=1707096 RepID=A0A8J2YKX9_9BACL|nr:DUF2269 family protein [Pullulanibacillus camelliae]GGE50837.1 hypothetical protein GCM10011391_32020 [Pullulanibacillus camelliae]
MSIFYNVLIFIHIFSAILGMGPGFVFVFIKRTAQTMTELRYSYKITRLLHRFVMIGGTLLLVTGVLMGTLNTGLFHQGWYVTSLILFLIALLMGPTVLLPHTNRIKKLISETKGEAIPDAYLILAKKSIRLENLLNLIFLIIIALMVTKPY